MNREMVTRVIVDVQPDQPRVIRDPRVNLARLLYGSSVVSDQTVCRELPARNQSA